MKSALIKRPSTIFLQAVIVLIGIAAVAFLLVEPHFEGRNVNATLFEIYFTDPFLAYAYIASIPFFVALYQACKLLGFIGSNEVFLQRSVKALRIIQRCAIAMIVFIVIGVIWLLLGESDDRPPIVAMGFLTTFASLVIATAAALFERILQNAVDMKSENDLIV